MLSTSIDEAQDFYTPQTITARELGDGLAQLIWESFSDFFTTEDEEFLLPQINVFSEDEQSSGRTSEEALIFFNVGLHARGSDGILRQDTGRKDSGRARRAAPSCLR